MRIVIEIISTLTYMVFPLISKWTGLSSAIFKVKRCSKQYQIYADIIQWNTVILKKCLLNKELGQ